jgi:hypothetical protein
MARLLKDERAAAITAALLSVAGLQSYVWALGLDGAYYLASQLGTAPPGSKF